MKRIVLLPGDGIGPEVMAVGERLLRLVSQSTGQPFDLQSHLVGQAAIEATGRALPPETLQAARQADAVLLAAVGGGSTAEGAERPETAILTLRQELDLFANLRPVRAVPGLPSPLRPDRVEGVDFLIVRETTSGTYFGQPKGRTGDDPRAAVDTTYYDEGQIARVAHVAFRAARRRRGKVTSVDKANVMATSRLWREVVTEVGRSYPEIELEHLLVDAAAFVLLQRPQRFDVLLTDNLFGDILSDEAGALAGGLGLLGSATLGDKGPGLFEPVHGSAPDIAGRGIANPTGMARSVALLLRHGLDLPRAADALDEAIDHVLQHGPRTPDLDPDGPAGTPEVAAALEEALADRLT